MTTAECLVAQVPPAAHPAERSRWAGSLCRCALFCALFSVVFVPEFPRFAGEDPPIIYEKIVAGFRRVDLFLLALVMCHIVAYVCLRRKRMLFPRSLAAPGLGFLGCIVVAIAYGARHGGNNFFFDWRGLALGVGLYFVWSFWLQQPSDIVAALRIFLFYAGARIAPLLILYVAGRGDALAGIAIPIFDGPVLSCCVFAGLLGFSLWTRGSANKLLCASVALLAYLLVLLSLRRTYWGELAVGSLILLLLRRRNRVVNFSLVAVALVISACILGSSFSDRLLSLDVTRDDTRFSADNADHVYDLIDAWYQVRQSPVMGIGLGTAYPTWHIRNWKPDSVMVHNAPLHVWLKYGIAGLICYLWFHFALLKLLHRRARAALSRDVGFIAAAFAYLTAQFVMTLGFAPWPYSELQLTTLISFILAAAVSASQGRTVRTPQRVPLHLSTASSS